MERITYHRLLIIPSGVRGIIYLFFLFGFCVRAQEVDSYEEFESLKGKVLSVEENYYTSLEHYRNRTYETAYKTLEVVKRRITFSEKGKKQTYEEYDTPTHCIVKTTFLYDKLYRLSSYTKIYDTGELSEKERDHCWSVIYQYDPMDNDPKARKTSALTYQGNLLKEYRTYTYDSLGQVTEEKISSIQQNQGKIYASTTHLTFTYDKEGKVTSLKWAAIPSGDVQYHDIFVYDTRGKISKKEHWWDNTSFIKYSYEYNEKGDLAIEQKKEGDVLETPKVKCNNSYHYTYTYDSFGNWTQRISTADDEVFLVTERIIKYKEP